MCAWSRPSTARSFPSSTSAWVSRRANAASSVAADGSCAVTGDLTEPARDPQALGLERERLGVALRQGLLHARERRRRPAVRRCLEQLLDALQHDSIVSAHDTDYRAPPPAATWAARPIFRVAGPTALDDANTVPNNETRRGRPPSRRRRGHRRRTRRSRRERRRGIPRPAPRPRAPCSGGQLRELRRRGRRPVDGRGRVRPQRHGAAAAGLQREADGDVCRAHGARAVVPNRDGRPRRGGAGRERMERGSRPEGVRRPDPLRPGARHPGAPGARGRGDHRHRARARRRDVVRRAAHGPGLEGGVLHQRVAAAVGAHRRSGGRSPPNVEEPGALGRAALREGARARGRARRASGRARRGRRRGRRARVRRLAAARSRSSISWTA